MKKLFVLSFFIHGLISIIAQVTILRELMTAFYGNELFVGASLGFWLLGAGLGSFLAHKISSEKFSSRNILSLNLFLLAVGLPIEIFLVRLFKGKFFLLGEIPNFLIGFVFAFLTLLPFCVILDAFFTLGTRFWAEQKNKKEIPKLISQAYLWETIGLATGGLAFNFILIRLTEFKVLFFLSTLSLLLAITLGKHWFLKWGGLVAFCLALFLAFSPFSSALNIQTLKFIHPTLVESVNSKYGKITVTSSGAQFNFFENGGLVGTNQNLERSEYLVHFLFTFHQNPKKILLIGGGFNGVISEILKYKTLDRIDYLELDPSFLGTIKKYLPSKIKTDLENPKVNIIYADGRMFLKATSRKYDLIILDLLNPSTALLNRFYTKGCFEETKRLLPNDGILATTLALPVDYLSREAESLVSSIYWTQRRVFPFVEVFPEETLALFLSSKTTIPTNDAPLKDIFKNRDVSTNFFTSEDISYRTKSDHIGRFRAIFEQNQNIKPNLDFFPTAYFYQIAFWQTQFSFLLAKIFRGLTSLNWYLVAILIYLSLLLVLHRTKKTISLAPTLVGTAGFTLMVFETLTIFTFQATLGLLFAKVSLVFTAFLFSIGLGNIWATGSLKQASRKLKAISLFLILYCPLYLLVLNKAQSEVPFYLLSLGIGFLVGAIFPLANQVFLRTDKKAVLKTGILYSADLFGAFFGAILTSIFLIPILGVHQTVYLTMAINVLLFLFLI
jgi:spermidine synthase